MSEETPKPATPVSPPPSPPDAAAKKGSWWPAIFVIGGILVVGLIVVRLVVSKPKAAPVLPPVQVTTITARQGDMGVYLDWALGAVTSIATVNVPSQVTGQLIKVNFVEGQMVRAGDTLAEIDPRPFQAQLDSTQGQLERDQALLTEAKMDLARYQTAYEQKAIPKQQLDDQAALVEQDNGTVKYDQGQVENAKVQLGFCRITSPVSGRVGLRLVDAGNIIQSSSTNGIVVVTQLQPITVIFSVAEDFLPQIQHQLALSNHMSVQAFDRAQTTNLATGTVLALDNLIDSDTGTVRLKAIFTNEDNALFPNQFVNVRLLLDTLHDQTLIPASTVQRNGTNAYVYVLSGEGVLMTNQVRAATGGTNGSSGTNNPGPMLVYTVEMRTVQVGLTDGETTAVKGVDPDEVLVADNFNRLDDKAKAAPRRPDGARKKSPP